MRKNNLNYKKIFGAFTKHCLYLSVKFCDKITSEDNDIDYTYIVRIYVVYNHRIVPTHD